MITVHLHGRLGKRFGRSFKLAADSAAEAVRALAIQLPGFASYISERRYMVSIGGGRVLAAEHLQLRLGRGRDVHITPAGAVAGIETIFLVGALILSAALSVVTLLMMPKVPKPSDREEATKTASFIFDGAENVSEQGHPVPLVYGRMRVGSVLVSAGISTTDVNQASVSADPTDPYGGGGSYGGYVGTSPGIEGSPNGRVWNAVALEKGGKGAGGAARAAQEDPNNLQSQATAKIVDVVSEGEIVGLVDGLKSVYFDDTPLQNPDGTFNFAGVVVEQRVGLPDQDFMPGFSQTESTVAVDTKVSVAVGPVVRSIDDQDATVARVTIRLPQLYQQDTTNGDMKASEVEVSISVQADGGGYTEVTQAVFHGKTTSGYQRSYDIRLPPGVERQIKVTRITADSTVASLSNDTYFDLLTAVVEAKLSYPDTALFGVTLDARQFGSNVPRRSYEIKGIIVEVPTNYDPVARTYTGVWDGTFKRAWTDNPAWVYRDIIVNRRYGLGQRVPASAVDKWGLYAISQYNDGLVPDGFGGTRPRYSINCCIMNAAAAYDVIASIASNFRGWAYWGSGSIMAAQDRPEDPSILVTPSNVEGGNISYGRITPLERRRSVAVVYWNDPDDAYKLAPAIYEDPDLVRRFGRRTGDPVTAFGVTNEGQAHRMARWIIEDERQSSNTTAGYGVGDDHGFVEPGRIAVLADPMYTASRRGGRVRSATTSSVRIDAPFAFEVGQDYFMRVILPDGTVHRREVSNAPGSSDTVTFADGALPSAPISGSVWTIESAEVAHRQFRVRSITCDEPPHQVRAVLHDPTKYDRVELGLDISSPNFMDLPTGPLEAPSGLNATEFLLQDGNASVPCVQLSWERPGDPRVTFFQGQFQRPGGNWEPFADGIDISRVVRNSVAGSWSFRVRSFDSLGNKTGWAQLDVELDGLVDDLPEVSTPTLLLADAGFAAKLSWDPPFDTRPLRYEVLYNFANSLGGAVSLGLVDVTEFPVALAGFYWVRTAFIDARSPAPAAVEVTEASLTIVAALSAGLSSETVSLTTDASGNVASYSTAIGALKVLSGSTDVSANFALSTISPGGNPQGLAVTYTGQNFSVTGGFDAAENNALLGIRATGSGAYAGILIDKVYTLSKSKAGAVGAAGLSNALVFVYKRSASAPTLPSASTTYTFATGVLTGLNNGWTQATPSGTDPLYVTSATASSTGATDSIAAAEWASAVVLAQNGAAGADGLNAATVYLFQRTATSSAPSAPGSTLTYTFATATLSGTLGSWTQTVPASSGGAYLWVTTATALGTSTTDSIAAAEWATVRQMAQDGAAGAPGSNNALVYIYRRAASVPTLPSATATYTFASGVVSGLNNSWTGTIPAGTDPLYVATAVASATGSSDTIASGEWATPVVMTQNGVDGSTGAAGLNAATVFLYQRNDTGTAPSVPASTTTYTFATGALSGTLGSWTQTVPADAGGKYLFVTTATALSNSATDTIATGEWAAVRVLAKDGNDGATGAPGSNNALVYIYQRATSAPTLPSATATYTFATAALSGLNNGWTANIPAGSNPLYAATAVASAAGASDAIASGEWATPVVLAQNGSAGVDGLNAATIFLYQRNGTGTPPSAPGSTTTYTFATGVLSGTLGSWTQTVPASSGGAYLFVTTATALSTGATDSVGTGEWATVRLLAQDGSAGSDAISAAALPPLISVLCTPTGTPLAVVPGFSITAYKGATNVTNTSTGTSYTILGSSGLTDLAHTGNGVFTVSGITADSAYADVQVTNGTTQVVRVTYGKVLAGSAANASVPTHITFMNDTSTYTAIATLADIAVAAGATLAADASAIFSVSSAYTLSYKLTYENVTDGGGEADFPSSEVTGAFTNAAGNPWSFSTTGSWTNSLGSTKVIRVRLYQKRTSGAGVTSGVDGYLGGHT